MRAMNRAAAAMLAAALLASACSGSVDVADPDPTRTPAATQTPAPAATPDADATPALPTPVPTPFSPTDGEALPVDPDVRTGTLDNGLTYYIRHNEAPGGRAEVRLAVNAGSAMEDADQSGVAHFLEHMLFNGTERYPANELIAALEAFGSEFGPDVNAFTSYDETVYELSIPTDNDELVSEAFAVLRDWATDATIDQAEVEAERGVVVEEWRLRDQGIGGRLAELYDELLTTDTPYQGRAPIGDVEALRAMDAGVLRRFYEDWYRPDLMAVVVVGDLDVDEVESTIQDRFGDIDPVVNPRLRPEIQVEANTERAYRRLEDPELPFAYVELVYAGPAEATTTVGDFRRSLAYEIGADILGSRFTDDVAEGTAPFLSAYSSTTPLARDLATPGLLAEAPASSLLTSFESLLVEVERIRRDGFTQAELDRVRSGFRSSLEQAYAGRGTTQDADYAGEYVANFLAESPMMGWEDTLEIQGRLLDDMTADYVSGVFLETIDAAAPEVVVVGPDSDSGDLPDEDSLYRLLDTVPGTDVAPRVDESRAIDSLMDPPEPAAVVSRSTNAALGSETLTFANGATVLLKATTIAENEFIIQGTSPGGLSVLPESRLAAATVASDVVTGSGVGDLSAVELDRLLADDFVSLDFIPTETDELLAARGATEDAETLFQLLHQYVVASNVDAVALDAVVTELEPLAADPGRIPSFAGDIALREARYGNGRRFRFLPTVAELDRLRPDSVSSVFQTMYGDAGDSTYAIVGDFDLATMTDLAARYLGTLPGDATADTWVDHQPAPPPGVVARTVAAGRDPQGSVTMLITAEVPSDETRDIRLSILENILSTRLRDQLREALGATYSPLVGIGATERPDEIVETFIQVSGDPERLPEILDEVALVLADLRGGGLTAAEVDTAKEQVRRDLELVSNSYWAGQMLYADAHPDIAMLTINQRLAVATDMTVGTAQALTDLVLLDDQFVVVSLVPAG